MPFSIYQIVLEIAQEFPQPQHFKTSGRLRKALKKFFDDNIKLFSYERKDGSLRKKKCQCHADGGIISAILLQEVKEKEKMAVFKIKESNRKISGIEQEASGAGWALDDETLKDKIEWADIRVVMDYADPLSRKSGRKDKNKQNKTDKYLPQFPNCQVSVLSLSGNACKHLKSFHSWTWR